MPATRYGLAERPEVLPFIPANAERILDIGCGHGAFGKTLRAGFPGASIVGIEPDPVSAEEAKRHYDHVIEGHFPKAIPRGELWDAIVFNDVLEHLADPWEALRISKKFLRPRGLIVASIPNIRYLPVLWELVIHGRWTYTDQGTLDRTHLRFFTRDSIRLMFDESNYRILRVQGVNSVGGRRWMWARLLPGSLADMQWLQFVVSAESI
ncbi:MAG: class I SAM-dependent methyltransferase [Pseudonocardiaceae bacterium]